MTRWTRVLFAVLVAAALVMAVSLIPVGYVIQDAGPTVNVLGSQGDTPVLEFSQSGDYTEHVVREKVPDDGQLRMVTVSSLGGPGTTVRVGDVVRAWFSPSTAVIPYSDLYAPETTAEDVAEAGAVQMESSHSASAIAAMDYLGIPMETTMTVAGTVPGSGADGQLLEGDVLVSLQTPDGVVHEVDSPSVPFVLMENTPANSTIGVTVLRDGEIHKVDIVTAAHRHRRTRATDLMGTRTGTTAVTVRLRDPEWGSTLGPIQSCPSTCRYILSESVVLRRGWFSPSASLTS